MQLLSCITKSAVQDELLRYEWDDWDRFKSYQSGDSAVFERLSQLSHRANIGFAVACGEWVLHRFGKMSDDPRPLDYLEATWAALIDWRYFHFWEPSGPKWSGPIGGPISLAILFAGEVVDRAAKGEAPARASSALFALASHVLFDVSPLNNWRVRILSRLEKFYPKTEDDPFGDAIPREAFDSDFDFQPLMSEHLINQFLSNLDHTDNSFLMSPEEMFECGFEGLPYSFKISSEGGM